ncbi:diacylglycerol/lipid kinase family protein [Hugenholtzia roseola]|uniref:diacylglycerol/lipid kinase family protein n=1 Tax=Hugenholtzia roseola TaxID=1002 RepID=UPI000408E1A3|nr:diacylglycerol kinase family protein [Hugenholtzia roseola]
MKKKYLFLLNPKSGTARKEPLITALHERLRFESDLRYEICYTTYAGEGRKLAAQAAQEGYFAVVAIGGDGTVNEVAASLLDSATALGIIPTGSGNGLARHLKIPLQPAKAATYLLATQRSAIDVGAVRIGNLVRYFFCTAGLGFDAHVSQLFAQNPQKRGLKKYASLVWQEFATYQPQTYQVWLENQTEAQLLEAFMLTFANAGQFGNDFYISPQADITDGKLDFCHLQKLSTWQAYAFAWQTWRKRAYKNTKLHISQIQKARICSEIPQPLHLDGDFIANVKEIEVEILPKKLKVLFGS